MSQVLGESLLQQPFDKYWDSPPTRREMQRMANKLAANDSELMGMADTASILLNFICEKKLNVNREEVELYVVQKTEELKALRAKAKADYEATQKADTQKAEG